MVSWLQQLAKRLRSQLLGPDSHDGPGGSRDPYSYVRHPLVRRPGGRNAAVALEEPDDDHNLQLIGDGMGAEARRA
jgi:hypothetical protein